MKNHPKLLIVVLCFAMMWSLSVSAMASNAPSSWAAEQVNAAIENKLVPQYLQSNYTQAITRAEFATLAVVLYENINGEITERSTFADTNDPFVQKAAGIGIVAGLGDNKFDPNGRLTREQAAVMLSRLSDAIGQALPMQAATFADNENISSWAIENVGQVQSAGIMSGVGGNSFAPQDSYTREQSIVTIKRIFDLANDQEGSKYYFDPSLPDNEDLSDYFDALPDPY